MPNLKKVCVVWLVCNALLYSSPCRDVKQHLSSISKPLNTSRNFVDQDSDREGIAFRQVPSCHSRIARRFMSAGTGGPRTSVCCGQDNGSPIGNSISGTGNTRARELKFVIRRAGMYGARIDLNIGVREVQVATSQPLNLDDADLSSLLPRPSRPGLSLLSTGQPFRSETRLSHHLWRQPQRYCALSWTSTWSTVTLTSFQGNAYEWTNGMSFACILVDSASLTYITTGSWPSDPAYYNHHFSNGPTWPEYIPPLIGVKQVLNFAYSSGKSFRPPSSVYNPNLSTSQPRSTTVS